MGKLLKLVVCLFFIHQAKFVDTKSQNWNETIPHEDKCLKYCFNDARSISNHLKLMKIYAEDFAKSNGKIVDLGKELRVCKVLLKRQVDDSIKQKHEDSEAHNFLLAAMNKQIADLNELLREKDRQLLNYKKQKKDFLS
ncbi:uncharacterized protein LOC124460254 [Drosophila willistoni]|uniref:uncharacterized protein LOC124460254 n=1 Tax=Drosophila willistoni TaxID=7260 RepID=UPI001F07F14C|nr:uncharacterized protein LOC124460254 [Drosophila willistoni]